MRCPIPKSRPYRPLLILAITVGLGTACDQEPAGPSAATSALDLATAGLGSWTMKASMPTARQGLAAAVIQNPSGQYILYAIGGTNGNNPALQRVEAYNAATNTWTRRASLPSKRSAIKAVVIGGKIYVAGGYDVSGTQTRTLYVYTPATDRWTRKADMPVASSGNITDVIGGKLYVLTGSCVGCTTQRLYRYDPATNGWTRLANPARQHRSGAGAAIDGKLYVAWGSSSTVDMYNPNTNRWTLKYTMTVQEFGGLVDYGGLFGAAGLNFNKRLYVVGGLNDDESFPGMLAYHPATNTWERKATMRYSREWPAAGKAKNAAGQLQILVAGGFSNDFGDYVTVIEAYAP